MNQNEQKGAERPNQHANIATLSSNVYEDNELLISSFSQIYINQIHILADEKALQFLPLKNKGKRKRKKRRKNLLMTECINLH